MLYQYVSLDVHRNDIHCLSACGSISGYVENSKGKGRFPAPVADEIPAAQRKARIWLQKESQGISERYFLYQNRFFPFKDTIRRR